VGNSKIEYRSRTLTHQRSGVSCSAPRTRSNGSLRSASSAGSCCEIHDFASHVSIIGVCRVKSNDCVFPSRNHRSALPVRSSVSLGAPLCFAGLCRLCIKAPSVAVPQAASTTSVFFLQFDFEGGYQKTNATGESPIADFRERFPDP